MAAAAAAAALAAPPASAISTHSNSNRPTSFRTRRTTIPSLPSSASRPFHPRRLPPPCQAAPEADDVDSSSSPAADEATQKYGLEFGLWKIFSSKEGEGKEKSKTEQAKELLAKYGGAYLATSITLSLISFSLCYALVSAGIDVQTLLEKVGVSVDETGEKVGTFALAYAAHKAASPIRFPPTVALTPIVASWIGKKVKDESK